MTTVQSSTNSATSCTSLPREKRTLTSGARFTRSLSISLGKSSKGFRQQKNKRSRCSNISGHLLLIRQERKNAKARETVEDMIDLEFEVKELAEKRYQAKLRSENELHPTPEEKEGRDTW